jgi:hypothetical protein
VLCHVDLMPSGKHTCSGRGCLLLSLDSLRHWAVLGFRADVVHHVPRELMACPSSAVLLRSCRAEGRL